MFKQLAVEVDGRAAHAGYNAGLPHPRVIEAHQYDLAVGLAHGDVKPDNVVVGEDSDEVRLVDFGLAGAMAGGSAAYAARWVAKNVVAAGLADKCEVQLAYAIGVAEPVSVHVNSYGTGKVEDSKLADLVRESFPLTPKGMIDHLRLRRPIFRKTAAFGHFGRVEDTESFTWEATDKAARIG